MKPETTPTTSNRARLEVVAPVTVIGLVFGVMSVVGGLLFFGILDGSRAAWNEEATFDQYTEVAGLMQTVPEIRQEVSSWLKEQTTVKLVPRTETSLTRAQYYRVLELRNEHRNDGTAVTQRAVGRRAVQNLATP